MKKGIVMVLTTVLLISAAINYTWADFNFVPNTIYMNWPTVSTRITDTFGTPRDGGRKHTGIDIGAVRAGVAGDSVYAALGGTVKANIDQSYGKVVYINSQGYNPWLKKNEYVQTRYVHVDSYRATPGQNVSRGQMVAKMGGTFGYDVHLHFETRIGTVLDMGTNDSLTIPRDPLLSYTFAEPYRIPMNDSKNSSTYKSDNFGEYGILKDGMLYTLDFILEQNYDSLLTYGITETDLEDLLLKLKNNDQTLYQKLFEYLE